jgi:hypothetical protein
MTPEGLNDPCSNEPPQDRPRGPGLIQSFLQAVLRLVNLNRYKDNYEETLAEQLTCLEVLLEALSEDGALEQAFTWNKYPTISLATGPGGGPLLRLLLRYLSKCPNADSILARKDAHGYTAFDEAVQADYLDCAHLLITWREPEERFSWPAPMDVRPLRDHLKMGITASGFLAVLAAMGFWSAAEGYAAGECFVRERKEHGLEWVNAVSPGKACGYDLQKAIKRQVLAQGLGAFSLVEIGKARGHSAIGPAEELLSHYQGETLEETFQAMMRREVEVGHPVKFFLDYTSLRQAQDDFTFPAVDEVISHIGHTTMMLTPLHAPVVPTRLFCDFELGSTLRHGKKLDAIFPAGSAKEFAKALCNDYEGVSRSFGYISFEDAEIRKGQENIKRTILDDIKKTLTLARANDLVSVALRARILKHLTQVQVINGSLHYGVLRFVAEQTLRLPQHEAIHIVNLIGRQGSYYGKASLISKFQEVSAADMSISEAEKSRILAQLKLTQRLT